MSDDHTTDEQPPRALTAFFVIVPEDGGPAYATTNPDPHTALVRHPTPADIRRGCQDVVHDLNATAAAQYVLKLQQENKPETPATQVRRARARRASEV